MLKPVTLAFLRQRPFTTAPLAAEITMKRLFIIRHAKSSWKQPQLSDHQRHLNKRGKRSIELMAKHLKKQHLNLDALYSSSAKRALATAEGLLAAIAPHSEIEIVDTLYNFDWEPLWQFLSEQPDHLHSLALIGHNPALQDLFHHLSLEDIDNLPTCGLLELELSIEHWHQLAPGCGQLSQALFPKQIK